MVGIAAVLEGRIALNALRRSLPRGTRLVSCRTLPALEAELHDRLIDAIVVGTQTARRIDLAPLRARYPTIPLIVMGPVRAEDAEAVLQWFAQGVAHLVVESIDEAVAGSIVAREGASRRRLAARWELPRLLGLSEPLQLGAWQLLAATPGRPPAPAQLARSLGVSREHLSRQFGAGGAPSLKRLSDFLTVQVALELLGNPGYDRPTVARLLGFSSPSHLRTTVQRVIGTGLREAQRFGWRELVRRFRMGGRTDRRTGGQKPAA
jgi:AraC-like DNA-binding protein